jgi:hypothetical protein
MNSLWGYLHKQNLAPIFVGECGDWLVTPDAQSWAAAFVAYMNGRGPGAPTLRPGKQGPSRSWWDWDTDESGGAVPDFGVLTAWSGGSLRPPQAAILNQLFFRAPAGQLRRPRISAPPSQPGERLESLQKPADVPAETLR